MNNHRLLFSRFPSRPACRLLRFGSHGSVCYGSGNDEEFATKKCRAVTKSLPQGARSGVRGRSPRKGRAREGVALSMW